jgi:Bacteriocin-protection, YdeI or OmpD-Associated/Domain of unknown function (DUF1905)
VHHLNTELKIIGINPFVFIPEEILSDLFNQAGKSKGHIPIKGNINGVDYKQTLVKYSGEWRLYINTTMLKNSPKRIGEIIDITIELDNESREVEMPLMFTKALKKDKNAKSVFESLPPSRSKEIVRYLANLKSQAALEKNIIRAINFLNGKERFVGRDKP